MSDTSPSQQSNDSLLVNVYDKSNDRHLLQPQAAIERNPLYYSQETPCQRPCLIVSGSSSLEVQLGIPRGIVPTNRKECLEICINMDGSDINRVCITGANFKDKTWHTVTVSEGIICRDNTDEWMRVPELRLEYIDSANVLGDEETPIIKARDTELSTLTVTARICDHNAHPQPQLILAHHRTGRVRGKIHEIIPDRTGQQFVLALSEAVADSQAGFTTACKPKGDSQIFHESWRLISVDMRAGTPPPVYEDGDSDDLEVISELSVKPKPLPPTQTSSPKSIHTISSTSVSPQSRIARVKKETSAPPSSGTKRPISISSSSPSRAQGTPEVVVGAVKHEPEPQSPPNAAAAQDNASGAILELPSIPLSSPREPLRSDQHIDIVELDDDDSVIEDKELDHGDGTENAPAQNPNIQEATALTPYQLHERMASLAREERGDLRVSRDDLRENMANMRTTYTQERTALREMSFLQDVPAATAAEPNRGRKRGRGRVDQSQDGAPPGSQQAAAPSGGAAAENQPDVDGSQTAPKRLKSGRATRPPKRFGFQST